MFRRTMLVSVLAGLSYFALNAQAASAEKIHEGIVISATADMLVMSDKDGKNEHARKVTAAPAVTIDGKPAKLPDLAKGDKIKVALDQDGQVVRIVATRTKK